MQVHTYDAETGRTGGGTFNIAAKSGTNEWHGSGFYQNRPKWGMAKNYFAERPAPLPDTYFHLGGGGIRRSDHPQPDVLLGRGRRLRLEHHPQRQPAAADRPREAPATSRRPSRRTASSW